VNILSPAESEIVTMVRAIVGVADPADATPVLVDRRSFPDKVSPTFVRLVEQSLAAGCTLALARRGGARSGRFLGGPDQLRSGRVWERHPDYRWRFEAGTQALIAWLFAEPLGAPKIAAAHKVGPSVTAGDRFFRLLAVDLLVRERLDRSLADFEGLAEPLCWFPALTGLAAHRPPPEPAAWAPLFGPDGVVLLEALQPALARWTLDVERLKLQLVDPARIARIGAAQEALLGGFLSAADQAGRRDLGAFVLDAAAVVSRSTQEMIAGNLDRSSTLRDRSEAVRARLVVLRQQERWARWDEGHRGVRFVDEGYVHAQHLLGVWERRGRPSWDAAQELLRTNA
jgi:hypothetical protein